MATTISKQKTVLQIFQVLAKKVKHLDDEPRPLLEQFLYAICREGVTREQADRAFQNLRDRFFDWNEIRVSSNHEVAEALDGLPDAETRGQRIIDLLQEVFESTFSFDLDPVEKKGVKQAAKHLARYQAANDYAIAWVVQKSLQGHAIPLDDPALRVLRRLGLLEEDAADIEALRACIEHQIPKAKGAVFVDVISHIADESCFEADPACPSCSLRGHCPTAADIKPTASVRAKPR